MIVDVFNEIYTKLKTDLTGITVLTSYPSTTPAFPCVVVSEISNVSNTSTIDTVGEHDNLISIEVNIFSNASNKRTEAMEIRGQVDTILSGTYRMSRDYSGEIANFADSNIYRYVLRYSFLIDSNKKIHRR